VFGTVLVATDGTERATRAVRRALDLVRHSGDTLHVVTAYEPPSVARLEAMRAEVPEEIRWRLSADSEADETLRTAEAMARQAGVEIETHAEQGPPARVILSVAGAIGASLIVVGSKGVERRILNSVPNGVAHEADCDVLIVHTA